MNFYRVILTDGARNFGPYEIYAHSKKKAFVTSLVLAHRPIESGGSGVPSNKSLLLAEPVVELRPVLAF